MSGSIRRFDLGAPGLEYLRQQLQGCSVLGRGLAERLDLGAGAVYTEFPADAEVHALLDFRSGGKLPVPPPETHRRGSDGSTIIPIPSMNHLVVERISATLREQPGTVCLLFDFNARWQDPIMRKRLEETRVLRAGDEIYHLLTGESANLVDVERVFRHAFQLIRFLGVVASLEPSVHLPASGGALNTEVLEEICRRTLLVFVGAYDGEGLVYWEPRSATI